MSSTASATLATLVQDQGRQLFDLVGLRDLEPLHRQCLRTDPVGQAGRDLRRRLRGTRLDPVESCSTPWAPCRPKLQRPARRPPRGPIDANRDGFVIAGGAGVRGARRVRARQGARREDLRRDRRLWRDLRRLRHGGAVGRGRGALHAAWRCQRVTGPKVDYINPHGTSTPVGDLQGDRGASARSSAGADKSPPISATKSLTGHSLGATGVQEAIYSLLMMQNGFICESAHIEELDPEVADMNIVRKRIDNVRLEPCRVEFLRVRRHQRHHRSQARRRLRRRHRAVAEEWQSTRNRHLAVNAHVDRPVCASPPPGRRPRPGSRQRSEEFARDRIDEGPPRPDHGRGQ